MKQLVKRMPKKQPKPKKKVKQKLSQKEKFIEYAKELECDETGETFDTAMNKIVGKKSK